MKIHYRFFLSHENSEKISIFLEKSVYFEKIQRENRHETSCFARRHNAYTCDVTVKDARNWCKKYYVTYIGSEMNFHFIRYL